MTHVLLRPAQRTEARECALVHRTSALAAYSTFFPPESVAPTVEDLERGIADAISDPACMVTVAVICDQIAGFALCRPDDEELDDWLVGRCYVRPSSWRNGIGRRLMEMAASEGRRRGLSTMGLRVIEQNTAARRLYESLGWRVVPGTQKDIQGDGVVEIRYRLPIELADRA